MDKLSAVRTIMGSAYVGDGTEEQNYWCEGEPARIEFERTDEDEIRIGVQVGSGRGDDATIYLSRSEAIRAVLAIAAAVGDQ